MTLPFFKSSTIHNDSRNFYEEDAGLDNLPGTNKELTPQEAQVLGPRTVVNGVTVRSSSSLENVFHSIRQSVLLVYNSTESYLNLGKQHVYNAERSVTGTMSSLHNRSEDLLPNSIYIAVAALSGNILAHRRGIVAKTVFPIVLGLGAFRYFLPQTFDNTRGFFWKVEQRSLPQLASGQIAAYEKAGSFVKLVENKAVAGQKSVESGVESAKLKLAKFTGVQLDAEVTKK